MPCEAFVDDMSCRKVFRMLIPLTVIFLFLYLGSVKLHPALHECVRDGKPCAHLENGVIPRQDMKAGGAGSLKDDATYLEVVESSLKNCKGKNFQIGKMLQSFHSCATIDQEILLEHYIEAWRELIKFMDSMGTVFTFISHETVTKINILQNYLDGENGRSYRTVRSMMKYELENGVVNFEELPPNRVPSGCRTLLRMHRALKWLEVFLYNIGTNPGEDKTSEMCAEAYHKTLAHYHSWFIRQVAEVAFLALPPIEEMYKVVCVQDYKEARVVLLTTVNAIVKVYNLTQELYVENHMLDLP
ncbi:glycolipid transfer protein domain-containing protein 2 isoform 2-T2 [Anomaloglossus baeobatrachus]|uniref:glycolipid transfer protein domain-containing protein 2 isoform X2 n=1 Tax=Anomaloglossus baeobatrachus TaxID=238106 RepID=UPI003F4FD60F